MKVIERMEMPSFDDVKNGMELCRAHRHGTDWGVEAQVEKLKKEYEYAPTKRVWTN